MIAQSAENVVSNPDQFNDRLMVRERALYKKQLDIFVTQSIPLPILQCLVAQASHISKACCFQNLTVALLANIADRFANEYGNKSVSERNKQASGRVTPVWLSLNGWGGSDSAEINYERSSHAYVTDMVIYMYIIAYSIRAFF